MTPPSSDGARSAARRWRALGAMGILALLWAAAEAAIPAGPAAGPGEAPLRLCRDHAGLPLDEGRHAGMAWIPGGRFRFGPSSG